ncbi:MAG: hypothetical protein KAW14_13055 [Candidatus Aegiribacteria sp.]|nr:hypothetical protein [Candidatus Aegiribacteria sp.]
MKTIMIFAAAVLIALFAACGAQPEDEAPISALDILPDDVLFSMAIINPAIVISSLDLYGSGIPILGETAVSGWILSLLDCADMAEVETKLGINIDGNLVFFMQSMMPQSIGAAMSVTDADVFWTNIGLTPEAGEPLDGYEVSTIDVEFGNLYFCSTRGLLLGAGSRAGLQSMLERIDGSLPASLPGIPDGSLYFYANVASFGPIAASQLAMIRPQIIASMDTADGAEVEITEKVLGMYFDIINLFLMETSSVDFVLSFESEFITGTSSVRFIPGSSLDQYIIPAEIDDMTGLVPAGNAIAARISIDPLTSEVAMNAVFGAIGIEDIPREMVAFWSQCSRNTAMSMTSDPDNPMHIIAVYEMPEGAGLEQVHEVYDMQFSVMDNILDMPGLSFSEVQYAELDGIEWVTFGMDMDMTALQPDVEDSAPLAQNVSWKAWLTVSDGILYVEMAEQPLTVPQLIAGTWQGETVGSMPAMRNISDSAEIAMMINVPEYLNMAMSMSGLEVPYIDADPVWLEIEVDFTGGGVIKHFHVSGTGLAVFIGQAIQMFGALSQ